MEHRINKNSPRKLRNFNQPQPTPRVAQRAPETQLHRAIAGAAPHRPRHGEDELGSDPTSWEGDRQFCPEVITTARGGAASTSCATGKNASYPHILHLASHGKGTARSDAKILKLTHRLSELWRCATGEKHRRENLATKLPAQLYCPSGQTVT